jgi:type IV pilus assembly protein PilA
LSVAEAAKIAVADTYQSNGAFALAMSGLTLPLTTAMVSVNVADVTGVITITYTGPATPTQINNMTLTLTPSIGTPAAALPTVNTGPMQWACASITNAFATNAVLPVGTPGSLLAKYAPANCR